METEVTPKLNIYQKLLEIQKHVIGLSRDKQAYGYKYITMDKILEYVKPKMNELGLLLKQEVTEIRNERQDYKTSKGEVSEMFTTLVLRFTWVDCETGATDVNMFVANGQNGWDKGCGSALTYSERYFFLKYFHLSTDEDDIDNPESKKTVAVAKKADSGLTPSTEFDTIGDTSKLKASENQKTSIRELLSNPKITKEEREKGNKWLETTFSMKQADTAIEHYKSLIHDRS